MRTTSPTLRILSDRTTKPPKRFSRLFCAAKAIARPPIPTPGERRREVDAENREGGEDGAEDDDALQDAAPDRERGRRGRAGRPGGAAWRATFRKSTSAEEEPRDADDDDEARERDRSCTGRAGAGRSARRRSAWSGTAARSASGPRNGTRLPSRPSATGAPTRTTRRARPRTPATRRRARNHATGISAENARTCQRRNAPATCGQERGHLLVELGRRQVALKAAGTSRSDCER